MTDKPIIFSAPMVRALLDGRKSQTRRVLKPQPHEVDFTGRWYRMPRGGLSLDCHNLPAAPGDTLWVREAWAMVPASAYRNSEGVAQRRSPAEPDSAAIYKAEFDRSMGGIRWRSPIHMPRWASRLTLTVTDVRVQRVQEISEEDAVAEGVGLLFSQEEIKDRPELGRAPITWTNYLWHGRRGITRTQVDKWQHQFSNYTDAKGSFSSLWEAIHGPGAWERNDWVAALTFTVRRGNIDEATGRMG